MKYKLQTLISVASIAVGIVTLSLVHSLINAYRFPSIYYESYYDRAYNIYLSNRPFENKESIRAIKKDGGPKSAEKLTVATWNTLGLPVEFLLTDSTVRKGNVGTHLIDPEYADFVGLRSAITGKKIRKLKHGEAIVSKDFADANFPDKNPIGAVQTVTIFSELPNPLTIVDVYNSVPLSDRPLENKCLYFCYGNGFEDYHAGTFMFSHIKAVLKEGCTEQQLLKEINDILEPYDLTAKLHKVSDDPEISKIIKIRLLSYIIGALILLVAIIGFLRIQTQLFWLRRHELALRIVNGAKRAKLFEMLFTEVAITICSAIIVALLLGTMLQNFLDMKLSYFMDRSDFKVKELWRYSIIIGGILIAFCSLIAWVTVRNICKANQGLSEKIRRTRQHLLHNVILAVQTSVIIIVVSATFILMNAGNVIIKACNVPENDSELKEFLFLKPESYNTINQIIDEIRHLPDLEKAIRCGDNYQRIKEIEEIPDFSERFEHSGYFHFYCTDDTTLLSALGMEIEWLNKNIDRNNCLLVSEKIYSIFKELGLIDYPALNIGEVYARQTLPIGGIIKKIPYDTQGDKLVAIASEWSRFSGADYVLIPKPGKGKTLLHEVNKAIEKVEPESFNKIVFNYREIMNAMPDVVETARVGGIILCIVSLIICAISILSTIALETRRKLKEVAIRKVNGAKRWDIYKMFGSIYLIIFLISLFIAVPVSVFCNQKMQDYVAEIIPGSTLSPVFPIIGGVTLVGLLILLIVWWQIRRVMRINPSTIIAKE